jgi:hypothetical protein
VGTHPTAIRSSKADGWTRKKREENLAVNEDEAVIVRKDFDLYVGMAVAFTKCISAK